MARAAVIGGALEIYGYGMAGAMLYEVADRQAALRAWDELPDDVQVVVLTAQAAGWLSGRIATRPEVLTAVMPGAAGQAQAGPPARGMP